ncbi:L,D-transpeptidase family protein [uncultured Desulfosarcina sp.]|uniref:L,D-transpeptidase family protein n=1 Tax=uncultured Desulfosarcina sp. TaxID=218289 RepID=UPI0029C84944|nr:L,D-transpeptidase family protein [uncultured Desulfosarcina sp.]
MLKQLLGATVPQTILPERESLHARTALQKFYINRGYSPAWSNASGQILLSELAGFILRIDEHGLSPNDYHRSALESAIAGDDPVAIELLATDAFLTMAAHLVGGRLNPVTIETDWTAVRRERDLVQYLEDAIASRKIAVRLSDLEPDAPGYAVLKHALAMYRKASKDGGWPLIPEGAALKPGHEGPRVVRLRERLRATGLLDVSASVSDRFDAELEAAVAMFQRRVGLAADGVVGPKTLRELNKRPDERVDQIRANLERWRWLPEDLGDRHIRVNIADFRLEARRNGRIERIHDVIVGQPYRMTPVFSGEISYVVLNPWWDIPDSIARLDKLPEFRKDPQTVARLGIEVLDRSGTVIDPKEIDWGRYTTGNFPFRLRQRPGLHNALGMVKIMFPNRHNVYLHDTPSRELFARTERAFSSGCVRVSDALGLTEWVLDETPGWTRPEIDRSISEKREKRVDLRKTIPVYILYFTAVTEPDGSLRLINDIYGRDARLIAALNGSRSVSKR